MRDPQNHVVIDDYGDLLDDRHRIITFGDSHATTGYKDEFIRALPQLKSAGIDTVAFEGMPLYMQNTLDEYARHVEPSREALLKHYDDFWASEPFSLELLNIIDVAHSVGMRVVAIEPDLPFMHKYPDENGNNAGGLGLLGLGIGKLPAHMQSMWTEFYAGEDPQSARQDLLVFLQENWGGSDRHADHEIAEQFIDTLEQAKALGLDLSGIKLPAPPDQSEFFTLGVDWRNQSWKRTIESALSAGSTGVAVFGGICHFSDSATPSLNRLLEQDGFPTIAVFFAGADTMTADWKTLMEINGSIGIDVPVLRALLAVSESAEELDLRDQRFAVRTTDELQQWIVHLPQSN